MKPWRLTNPDLDLVVWILKTGPLPWVLCYQFKCHETSSKWCGGSAHPGLLEGPSSGNWELKLFWLLMDWLLNLEKKSKILDFKIFQHWQCLKTSLFLFPPHPDGFHLVLILITYLHCLIVAEPQEYKSNISVCVCVGGFHCCMRSVITCLFHFWPSALKPSMHSLTVELTGLQDSVLGQSVGTQGSLTAGRHGKCASALCLVVQFWSQILELSSTGCCC